MSTINTTRIEYAGLGEHERGRLAGDDEVGGLIRKQARIAVIWLANAPRRNAAADLILTRRRVMADEALRLELVSAVADAGGAVERAVATAQAIVSATPPVALAAVKRRLRPAPEWTTIRDALADMSPAEWREGASAFLAKRAPDYARFWIAPSSRPRPLDDRAVKMARGPEG